MKADLSLRGLQYNVEALKLRCFQMLYILGPLQPATRVDFNYVKPRLDLLRLKLQLSNFVLFMKQIYVTMTRWYILV